jgi:hypothetical protein
MRLRSSTSERCRYANESSEVLWWPTLREVQVIFKATRGSHEPVAHGLDEHRTALLERASAAFSDGSKNSEDVVAVDADLCGVSIDLTKIETETDGVNAIARPSTGDAVAVILLRARCTDGKAVVARDEKRRRGDGRREEQTGVEI